MKIPPRFRQNKRWIEVVYQQGYVGGDKEGLWDPNARVIFLRSEAGNMSKELTFIHEALHAISDDFGIGLTHEQVYGLERPLRNLFRELCKKRSVKKK